MRIAICPGSYDPVTFGHLNVIKRSAVLFDKVIVAVMVNSEKTTMFTAEQRVKMLKEATADIPNVEIEESSGLVAEYAKQKGASALIKGLRAVTDFEYEFQMALINKKLNPGLETVFIATDMQFMFLSSSSVREIANFGGDLSDFVPLSVEKAIREKCEAKIHFGEGKT